MERRRREGGREGGEAGREKDKSQGAREYSPPRVPPSSASVSLCSTWPVSAALPAEGGREGDTHTHTHTHARTHTHTHAHTHTHTHTHNLLFLSLLGLVHIEHLLLLVQFLQRPVGQCVWYMWVGGRG